MKALLLSEYKKLDFVDQPDPEFADDEVLIRVAACGVCGSDVHGWDGSTGRRVPPLIMGHEAAGVVEKVGSNVSRAQPGDRVTFDSTVYCGVCAYCRRGEVNLCNQRQVLGVSCGDYRRHGAFAEYLVAPERILYPVPDTLPLEHAALVEPVSIAVHAVRRAALKSGESTVVVGTGMIGLLIVQALRAAGAKSIVAVDIAPERLELAEQMGATATVDARSPDLLAALREHTGGGVDASFEAVGTTECVTAAIECVRKGGSVTLVGNVSPKVEVPLQSIVTRELTLYGSCGSQGEYPKCIELMASGAIDVEPLITATAPLEEGPAWFERLYAREPGLMKVVLRP